MPWRAATSAGQDWQNGGAACRSGAQRLPNGNTLICEGMTGRLFEVTSVGEVVWEYVTPFFRTTSVLGGITLCSVPIATRRTSQGCGGKPVHPEAYAWMNHLYAGR